MKMEQLFTQKSLAVFYILVIAIFFLTPLAKAGECEYGTLHAWYSKDGQEWQNATVHHTQLSPGDSFYIKITFNLKTGIQSVDLKTWETGEENPENSTYRLIQGLNCFFSYVEIKNLAVNQDYTYVMKLQVKPNASWVHGNAPLNIYAQFNQNDKLNRGILFTVANIYIQNHSQLNETSEDTTPKENHSLQNMAYGRDQKTKRYGLAQPHFILLTAAVLLFLFIKKFTEHKI